MNSSAQMLRVGHLAYTPLPSRSNTPPQSFSLPPIRELLKDTRELYPMSPPSLATDSRSQSSSPVSQTPLPSPLQVVPPMPNTAHQQYQHQQHYNLQHQHHHQHQYQHQHHQQLYAQHRQRQLDFEAQLTVQRAHEQDPVPKEVKSGRKKRQNLPRQTTLVLLSWLSEHLDRPYPNSREKYDLLLKTRLTIQQLDNWFINARRRKITILKKLKETDQNIALSL